MIREVDLRLMKADQSIARRIQGVALTYIKISNMPKCQRACVPISYMHTLRTKCKLWRYEYTSVYCTVSSPPCPTQVSVGAPFLTQAPLIRVIRPMINQFSYFVPCNWPLVGGEREVNKTISEHRVWLCCVPLETQPPLCSKGPRSSVKIHIPSNFKASLRGGLKIRQKRS